MPRQSSRAPWKALASDRTRGAHALALRALALLERDLGRWGPGRVDARDFLRWVAAWASGLRTAQPAMGALMRLGDWLDAERRKATSVGALRRRLRAGILGARRRLNLELAAIVRTARGAMPRDARVVTFSRSETVLRVLVASRGTRRPKEVRSARSLPGGEGARLARELRRAGVPAHVVEDRGLVRALRDATLVLVGADTVYRDGSLVHKVGTRALARAARRSGIPLICVTGRSKVVDRSAPRAWRGPALFDVTPARYVQAY